MRRCKRIRKYCLLLGVILYTFSFSSHAASMEGAATENPVYRENENWEEEYTDTDTRRGTLAVRADVFQGFHGLVQAVFQNANGGKYWFAELDGEHSYLANLSLPAGTYWLIGLNAVSDGREFDCEAGQEEISVKDGETVLYPIIVEPGSLYRLPYEETNGETEGTHNTEEKAMEQTAEGTAEPAAELATGSAAEPAKSSNEGQRTQGKIPIFLLIGLMGMGACTTCLFCVIKKNREGG